MKVAYGKPNKSILISNASSAKWESATYCWFWRETTHMDEQVLEVKLHLSVYVWWWLAFSILHAYVAFCYCSCLVIIMFVTNYFDIHCKSIQSMWITLLKIYIDAIVTNPDPSNFSKSDLSSLSLFSVKSDAIEVQWMDSPVCGRSYRKSCDIMAIMCLLLWRVLLPSLCESKTQNVFSACISCGSGLDRPFWYHLLHNYCIMYF